MEKLYFLRTLSDPVDDLQHLPGDVDELTELTEDPIPESRGSRRDPRDSNVQEDELRASLDSWRNLYEYYSRGIVHNIDLGVRELWVQGTIINDLLSARARNRVAKVRSTRHTRGSK